MCSATKESSESIEKAIRVRLSFYLGEDLGSYYLLTM